MMSEFYVFMLFEILILSRYAIEDLTSAVGQVVLFCSSISRCHK